MGVDCNIWLPRTVRGRDIADVIGICAGFKPIRVPFTSGDGWHCSVPGVKFEPSLAPECANIIWKDAPGRHKEGWVMLHYEVEEREDLLLMPRSTPFWLCVGRKLIDFFGSTVDYQDCDGSKVDYWQPKVPTYIVQDGCERYWQEFQERKMGVVPVTLDDMKSMVKFAAYSILT